MLILDIQHIGKPNNPRDVGAHVDIDGNGMKDAWEAEAALTPIYAYAAAAAAESLGHVAIVVNQGHYWQRHNAANALAASRKGKGKVLYVACHLNAGGGNYGLVLHDSRSKLGASAAAAVVEGCRPAWDRLGVRVLAPQQTSDGHPQWPRAYQTIDGIYAGPANIAGICFEPLFVDTHRNLLRTPDALQSIGRHLAQGFHNWSKT